MKENYEISEKDLPLCCPLPKDPLWNAHPRVYLPIEETGKVCCPYCSTEYVLKDYSEKTSSSIYSDFNE